MPDEPFVQPLPGNHTFERRVLGAALTDADALTETVRKLRPEDFQSPEHQAIFEVLKQSMDEGEGLTADLVAHRLANDSDYPGENPYALISELVLDAAPPLALNHYADIVRGTSQARGVFWAARELMDKAHVTDGSIANVVSLIGEAEGKLHELSSEVMPSPWQSTAELQQQSAEEATDGSIMVLPTGFSDLDRVFQGGFRTKELITLAARAGMGKSTLAMDIARHLSIQRGVPGLFLSLEMSGTELMDRIHAAESGVALSSILGDSLSDAESERLREAASRVGEAPLYISDMEDVPLDQLRALAISAQRHLGIKYLIVDYLQLVTNDLGGNRTREQEVSGISRSLKKLAKKLNIAVIAVAQLNRGPDQRQGNRPQISDLRESGSIEQDSNSIILLFRPEYYDPNTDRVGEADAMVEKHRNGPKEVVPLCFQGVYSRFTLRSRDEPSPGM